MNQLHLSPLGLPTLRFELTPDLIATEPPEARGLARDQVRLMVSGYQTDQVAHTRFTQLADYLQPGDVLVINTSGTMNAALEVQDQNGQPLELHLSTRLPDQSWVVELRRFVNGSTKPYFDLTLGDRLFGPDGAEIDITAPYMAAFNKSGKQRLWCAVLNLPLSLTDYLKRFGYPIRYDYVKQAWPISYYQTVFATDFGSAEMPSAGRGFTPELVTQLVSRGVQFAPVLLHTGVASLEADEPPYEEFYAVSQQSAELVNRAKGAGQRIIGIGTTAVRALESASDRNGFVYGSTGWTDLIISPERGLNVIDGLLTGFHEPQATHIAMLGAVSGMAHLEITYREALDAGYLWHEFGDLHLLLPDL